MASSILPSIKVIRCEPELVRPSKPTPREVKLLSDLDDQEAFRFQLPMIFFYKNSLGPSSEGRDPIRVIREALGRALVHYYPLAGRLREGFNRKLAVDCTGEGALFVAAEADVGFDELGDAIRPPCPFLDEFLASVPGSDAILGCPLLLFQVTRFNCGGFVVALRINHTMCDGFGIFQFSNAVAEMARGQHAPSVPPVWQRHIFNARNPPRITYPHHEYQHTTPPSKHPNMTIDPNNNVQKSFFFGPRQVQTLRDQVPGKASRFDLVTACLWKCRTIALNLDPHETVKVSCVVNMRGKSSDNLRLPRGYYGVAFAYPAAVSRAGVLTEAPLGYAAGLVQRAKAEAAESGGEYLRSVADLMASRGRPSYAAEGNYIVSDNTRIAYSEVDFGWGPAAYAGPVEAMPLLSYICSLRHDGQGGRQAGVVVPICLPSAEAMERFGREVRKMTGDETPEIISVPNQGNKPKGFKINFNSSL